MNVSIRSRFIVAAALGAVLSAQAPPLASQEAGGSVQGTVIDGSTKQPLANAQVSIVGTRSGALTNSAGVYRIPGVTAGQVEVRVRLIGYAPTTKSATVSEGQTADVDFSVSQSAISLTDVVVTGTGGAVEERKLGNTVAKVDLTDIQFAPISSPSEVLQGRVPGVASLPSGGLTGEGARIRIRGNASLSQSNEAIVYIDGVRADNGGGIGDPTLIGTGGAAPSRLDDIDPESIDKIEILKGAAAATLYGTEASNGVIQIFTKRGEAGPPRWTLRAERSASKFPDRIKPQTGFARTQAQADLLSEFYGQDIAPFEIIEKNLETRLQETGFANALSGSVAGGTQAATYYVSGRFYDEDGPFTAEKVFEGSPFTSFLKDVARDENRLYQGTANINLFPRDNLRFSFRTLYTDRHGEFPGNNNNIYAPFTLAQFGKPEAADCTESAVESPGICEGSGDEFGNGAFSTVREALLDRYSQDVTHFNGVMSAAFTPITELTFDATFGVDNVNARSVDFLPFGNAVDNFSARNPNGERTIDNTNTQNITLDSKLTWSRDLTPAITSSFVFGGQGFITRRQISGIYNFDFPGPGLEIVEAGGTDDTINERFVKVVNAGVFAQEQLGFGDWVFATVGARYDKNSAFGEEAGGELYPKASISLVPSDRAGWSSGILTTLRLRAAYGKSGRQPGAFDKFTTFEALASDFGAGLVPSNLGNPALKPEISTEIEVGTELGLFQDKVGLQVTYWDRNVNDALVLKQFAPSGGFIDRQLANVGKLSANGWEVGLNSFIVNRPNFSFDVFANGAYLKQEVVSLGGAPPLKVGGSYPRYRNFLIEGFAPGALFGAKLLAPCSSYGNPTQDAKGGCLASGQLPYDVDRNGTPDTEADLLAIFADPARMAALLPAGLTSLNPLRADDDLDGDFLDHFLGKPYPDWQGGFGGNIRFLQNFRLSTLFEYKAGNYKVTNLTDAFRQANPLIGRNIRRVTEAEAAILNPAASPQAKLAAAKEWLTAKALSPYDGLNQNGDGDFLRWRELSVTYSAPQRLASILRARDASLTFGVRNLALWTKYDGTDPESNAVGRGGGEGGTDENFLDAVDAFGFPLSRRFSFALRLNY
ncbi:MAG: SusC/RagA family TonB-linked outer membrane protein [Anaerolineae bacterium]|nr:SusC/RagA family TonB-linked outer membrane protein [Gemmatimonadaceae bacterium]